MSSSSIASRNAASALVSDVDVLAAQPRLDRLGVVAERRPRLVEQPLALGREADEERAAVVGVRHALGVAAASSRLTRKITVESGMSRYSARPVGVNGPSAPIVT